jgi:hypothetical protein
MVGDQDDFIARLKAVLPRGWVGDPGSTPVLDGLLAGIASIWVSMWALLSYVEAQRRIATATDINLDIIASDFLGTTLSRRPGEADAAYSSRIRASIFQEMGTRQAISDALTRLTGSAPRIFEPSKASDTGGYGAAGAQVNTGLAYGVAGGYGSYNMPFQALIETNLPSVATTVGVQGYGGKGSKSIPARVWSSDFSSDFGPSDAASSNSNVAIGGYGVGAIEYSSGVGELLSASDQEVYDAINSVKPVATIMWVSTQKTSPQTSGGQSGSELDSTFVLNVSRLSGDTLAGNSGS